MEKRKQKTSFFVRFLWTVLLLSLCSTDAFALSGRIVGVADGDTVKVRTKTGDIKIRLYGIDAPEKQQAFGNVSKKAINRAIRGKFVRVQEVTKDRYGRTVGIIYLNGENVNEAMVRNGMAWVYTKYCKADFCNSWKQQERQAQHRRIGLWRDKNPTPPWKWRKKKNETQYISRSHPHPKHYPYPSTQKNRQGRCTWVRAYTRKDGTYVRGHRRCSQP